MKKTTPIIIYSALITSSQAAILFSTTNPNVPISGFGALGSADVTSIDLVAEGHTFATFDEVSTSTNPFSINVSFDRGVRANIFDTGTGTAGVLDFNVNGGLPDGESITVSLSYSSGDLSSLPNGSSNTAAPLAFGLARFGFQGDAPGITVDLTTSGAFTLNNNVVNETIMGTTNSITATTASVVSTGPGFEARFRDQFNDGSDAGPLGGWEMTITNNTGSTLGSIFRITVDGTPVAVPEPNSSAFILLGLLTFWRRSRK